MREVTLSGVCPVASIELSEIEEVVAEVCASLDVVGLVSCRGECSDGRGVRYWADVELTGPAAGEAAGELERRYAVLRQFVPWLVSDER